MAWKLLFSVVVVLCVTFTEGLDNGQVTSAEFCYDKADCGPKSADWGGQCHSGVHQSPINLPNTLFQRFTPAALDFNDQYKSNEFWIVDNGHTVQLTLQADPTSNAEVSGYEFDYPYKFAQIHFHWGPSDFTGGSEHTVNGIWAPMEAHLVHYDSKYANFSVAATSGDPKGLAVLAVFIADSSLLSFLTPDSAFDTIANNIPAYNPTPTHVQKPIDLSVFLPKKGQAFYRYMGSLTTPGCTEAVQWTVVRDPVFVKMSSINKFRKIQSSEQRRIGANHRPIQPAGDRKLEYLSKK